MSDTLHRLSQTPFLTHGLGASPLVVTAAPAGGIEVRAEGAPLAAFSFDPATGRVVAADDKAVRRDALRAVAEALYALTP